VYVHLSVHLCVVNLEQKWLARYLVYLLTEFDQIFITDGLWDRDERVNFWGQKVKGQGHGEVKYAPKHTF